MYGPLRLHLSTSLNTVKAVKLSIEQIVLSIEQIVLSIEQTLHSIEQTLLSIEQTLLSIDQTSNLNTLNTHRTSALIKYIFKIFWFHGTGAGTGTRIDTGTGTRITRPTAMLIFSTTA